MSIPRVFIFKAGELKQQLVGLRSEADLTNELNSVLTS